MSNQAVAVATKREMVDSVVMKVKQFRDNKEIHFPMDYSPENALKSAWLTILETENKEGKSALSVCTPESVGNAMLSMVIQGLNTDKKQGYYIMYGNKLQFQRSYFGTMVVCKRVCPEIADIVAQVVYEDDVFKYKINPRTGKKEITEHEQTLESVDSKKVKAVYCLLIDHKENVIKTEIMTFEQIKQAWKQSKMYPVTDKGDIKVGSTHDKFLEEMCKKTIINKVCKPIINASDDRCLGIVRKLGQDEYSIIDAEIDAEIEQNANSVPLLVDDAPMSAPIDYDTGEIIEEEIEEETKQSATNTESVLQASSSSTVAMQF